MNIMKYKNLMEFLKFYVSVFNVKRSPSEVQQLISVSLTRLLVEDRTFSIDFQKEGFAYLDHFLGKAKIIPGRSLEWHEVKIKDKKIKIPYYSESQSIEEWDQKTFLSMRLYFILELYTSVIANYKTIPFNVDQKDFDEFLVKELWITGNAYRVLNECSKKEEESSLRELISEFITSLTSDEFPVGWELCYPCGTIDHAAYLFFIKYEHEIVIRIDNFIQNSHADCGDKRLQEGTPLHYTQPLTLAVIKLIEIQNYVGELENYLLRVTTAKKKKGLEALAVHYEIGGLPKAESKYEAWEYKKEIRHVSNCMVNNYRVGIQLRANRLSRDLYPFMFLEELNYIIRHIDSEEKLNQDYNQLFQYLKKNKSVLATQETGLLAIQTNDLQNFINLSKMYDSRVTIEDDSSRLADEGYADTISALGERNLKFTGRKEELQKLKEAFSKENTDYPVVQAICGLGGIGKSQLAKEYAYQSLERGDYRLLGWIDASNSGGLLLQFLKLADELGINSKLNPEERKNALLENLNQVGDWLLIFDDAIDNKSLLPYYPKGKGHVLIISRNVQDWINQMMVLNLFRREESIEFIAKRMELITLSEEIILNEVNVLADLLRDFPLALAQAVAFIEQKKKTISEYINLFETRRGELWKQRTVSKEYPDTVEITSKINLEAVKSESKYVLPTLLNYLAYLSYRSIPRSILKEIITDESLLNYVVEKLSRYELIHENSDQETISFHKFIQLVIRDSMTYSQSMMESFSEILCRLMSSYYSKYQQSTTYKSLAKLTDLLSNCESVIDAEKEIKLETKLIADFYDEIGIVDYHLKRYSEALKYSEKALKIRHQILGEAHPDIATSLYNIGRIYQAESEYVQALKYTKEALRIRRQVLREADPDVALYLNLMGIIYRYIGDYVEALKYFEEALDIGRRVLGESHSLAATSLHNIGVVYEALGQYISAYKYCRDALDIRTQLGKEYLLDVAKSCGTLMRICRAMDDPEYRSEYALKALKIKRQVLGETHPDLVKSLNNASQCYENGGNYEKALKCAEQVLMIQRRVPGEVHPYYISMTLNNIADIYGYQKEYRKALQFHEEALKISIQAFGEEHSIIKETLTNIAIIYKLLGINQIALNYLQRALIISQKKFGVDHYDTIKIKNMISSIESGSSYKMSTEQSSKSFNKEETELLQNLVQKYNLFNQYQDTLEKGFRNAVLKEATEDVQSFIKFINDIDAQDENSASEKTVLHWAVIKENKKIIQILLENNASTDIPDATGKTAKDYAAETSNEEIKTLLNATQETRASFSK